MICPICKCEYVRGVTQCADCGVALVDAPESPGAIPGDDVRLVAIWRGDDPAESGRVKEALENAGIPFTAPDSKSHFSFLPTEARLEIWISETDREKARKVLLDMEEGVGPNELTLEEIESLALPESDQREDNEQALQTPDSPDDWNEDDPVAEVWKGDGEEFANNLTACLREIGVESRKLLEAGHWRIVVRPEQETRAREIVREVVEASPPE